MNEPKPDIRLLVRWLGVPGAKAGITESKYWTLDVLREVAKQLGVQVAEKTGRKDLIEEVVRFANRRIDKPLSALYEMDATSLAEYFERVGVESQEILDLLKELDLTPRKEGRKNLIDFAARELSETGRFMRISGE